MIDSRYQYPTEMKSGLYRAPLAFLMLFTPDQVETLSKASEFKTAYSNLNLFPLQILTIVEKVKKSLENKNENNRTINLYVFTQALFLFGDQYLQDTALVLRAFLPKNPRENTSPKFHKMREKYLWRDEWKQFDEYFKGNEKNLNVWKDIRDDILHRTSFDKARGIIFPNIHEFKMITDGGKDFLFSSADYKYTICMFIDKLFHLSCIMDDYLRAKRFPNLKLSYYAGSSEDAMAEIFISRLGVGSGILSLGRANIQIMDWIFKK